MGKLVTVEVDSGICGFTTLIHAEDKTQFKASFRLETACPNWKKIDAILGGKDLDVMRELFKNKETGVVESQIFDVSLKTLPHVSCPVISGILKALEVSVGLALPKNATITFK